MSIYDRLKNLLSDQSRSFVSFANEHHKDTYIERQKDESSNDYNDRSIRVAARWYTSHLNAVKRVVLLTDDKNNAKVATSEGIEVLSVDEFVTLHEKKHPHIRELVASSPSEVDETQGICLLFKENKANVYDKMSESGNLSMMNTGIRNKCKMRCVPIELWRYRVSVIWINMNKMLL